MRFTKRLRTLGYAGLALALCSVVGCGAGKPHIGKVDDTEVQHMNKAKGIAMQYQSANKGKPLTAEAIKEWAAKTKKPVAAEDLQSTRDHKDYLFAPDTMGVIVYEAEGSGERYISSMQGAGPKSEEEIDKILNQGKTGGPGRGMRRGG